MGRRPLVLLICALLPAGPAYGQAQAGDLGIFITATPTSGADAVRNDVAAFEPFGDIFVVSFDVPGGMDAYGFYVHLPQGLSVSGGEKPAARSDRLRGGR